MKTVCIMCPKGCELEITENNGEINVSGNDCKIGLSYGKEEYVNPKRIVTALIKTKSGKIRPVKTINPVPKDKIFELLDLIKTAVIDGNLKQGDIAIKNALGLTDIILTN